jgi:hypothetical protein
VRKVYTFAGLTFALALAFSERLERLSQHLNLTEDQKKQLKPILAGEFKQMRAVGGGSADNHHGHNSGQWRQIEVRNRPKSPECGQSGEP